jgi:phage gp36-like protein
MSYATVADLLADAPAELVAQLTGAVEPDEDKIERALENASGKIDSYLASRYPVPLTDAPIMLRTCCVDMALYELMKLRPLGDIEDARLRYTDALRFLEQVNQGKINIGPAPSGGDSAPSISGSAFIAPPSIMKGLDY